MEQSAVEDPFCGACRVCLTKTSQLSTLFEVLIVRKVGEMTLSEMILLLCGVKIDPQDGMPGTVCTNCRMNLLAAFEFRLLCLQSDEDMRMLMYKKEAPEEIQLVEEKPEESPELKEEVKDEESQDVREDEVIEEDPREEAEQNSPPDLVPISSPKQKRKNAKREHVCPVCKKVFDKAYRLLRHANIHNAKGKPFECQECKQRFASESNLLRHQIVHSNLISETTTIVHEKPKSFQCIQCDRVFLKQESLASHMKTHNE